MYKKLRKNIEEGSVYDNVYSPVVLFRARTNTLQLEDRRRFGDGCMVCRMCGAEMENLYHFILWCPELGEERSSIVQLQQPYQEDEEDIVGRFLFDEEEMEEKKKSMGQLWKARKMRVEVSG
jgi:hypothetical protein